MWWVTEELDPESKTRRTIAMDNPIAKNHNAIANSGCTPRVRRVERRADEAGGKDE
jgi:hypothetical protein